MEIQMHSQTISVGVYDIHTVHKNSGILMCDMFGVGVDAPVPLMSRSF